MESPRPHLALWVLLFAVSMTALSALIGRAALSAGLGPIWLAALRMICASALLLPFVAGSAMQIERQKVSWALLSGFFLALHFATWISSLAHTSVLISGVLVCSTPLFVALLSPFVTGDRIGMRGIIGLSIAVLGGAILVFGGGEGSGLAGARPLLGAALATAGALAMTGHWLFGRRLRQTLSLASYVGWIYPSAALCLIGMAFWVEGPPPAIGPLWLYGLAMAVGPQIIGHSSLNWALRHLPPSRVAGMTLLEPIFATLLVFAIEGAEPRLLEALGAAVILIGIALEAQASRVPRPKAAPGSRAALDE